MVEKKLANLLSRPDGALSDLVDRAREMQSLGGIVRAALPPDARPHMVAATCRDDGTLVLITESSAWAARLRFSADEAIAAAIGSGIAVERCRVLVRPRREGDGPTPD